MGLPVGATRRKQQAPSTACASSTPQLVQPAVPRWVAYSNLVAQGMLVVVVVVVVVRSLRVQALQLNSLNKSLQVVVHL